MAANSSEVSGFAATAGLPPGGGGAPAGGGGGGGGAPPGGGGGGAGAPPELPAFVVAVAAGFSLFQVRPVP